MAGERDEQTGREDEEAAGARRQRNAARSREAILDAAEWLFAEKGYEATSLKEVGEAAGVSRGTPSYFFGSKEGLYRAVLDRVLRDAGALVELAKANLPVSGGEERPPEEAILEAIGPYIDFLACRPSYGRLVERETLGRAARGSARGTAEAGEERHFPPVISMLGTSSVDFLADAMGREAPLRAADPKHLAASMIALCSFPFMLGGGLARTLGIDPDEPTFVEKWKRHVADLLIHGIFTREGPSPTDPEHGP